MPILQVTLWNASFFNEKISILSKITEFFSFEFNRQQVHFGSNNDLASNRWQVIAMVTWTNVDIHDPIWYL